MSDWISVKDRLPNKGDIVLAYCQKIIGEIRYVLDCPTIAKIEWENIDCSNIPDTDYFSVWAENITHWMPLPEPPKEKPSE